jgi:hypothetical protein
VAVELERVAFLSGPPIKILHCVRILDESRGLEYPL